ncbi:MAG: hypothetical protein ACTH3S_16615 [Marinobacter sp.]|uniref:hypothetical protein n=1 Tax=Marinobacter sp. TaxID=50741 RepID=UPI003F9C5B28
MNNTETSPLGAESKNFFSKLTSGDFGLAKTYWLFGVVVGIVLNLIIKFTPSIGGLLVILALAVVYQVMVLLGVWRAANRYQGRKAWTILAKIAAVLGWLGVLANLGVLVEIMGYL